MMTSCSLMLPLGSKMMITDSQVLLDCCSREMKRVKGWGEQNSSNIITEDLPKVSNAVIFSLTNLFFKHFCVLTLLHKAAYASQPLHLETAPSLSPHRGPGCLSSDANVDRLCVPVFCVSALLQHLPSDLGSVAAGEVTQSAFISTLGYAYVAESISRSVDATSSHLGGSGSGESGEEVIKKVQISTRPIGEDDAELLTRCLIHNYTESIIEESKRDVQRRMHSEQSLQEKERSSQLPSSDHDHDCATSTSTLPTPAVTETFKAFVNRSGTCSLRCILSVCVYVYSSSSSSNIRLQSLKTSRVAYCSETNREAYEILLATGCGHDPVSGEVSGTLCDVRMLDSSLKVLAVLGMDDPCALTAVTSSTYQCHELSVPLSLPLPPSLPAEGQGKGVESVKASESKATSLDMPWRSAAIYLITSACLVPAVCVPQSSYSNKLGEIAVALVTAYSKERPLLSNKLLFWQPLIRSDGVSKISSLKEREEESGFSHTQECISTAAMAANCSDLPFINMPAISGTWNGTGARKEVTGLGSRGPHMLASTSGTGQHQYLVLGDINGHVWGTTIGPHTDFPGPMYPPGFTLMQRVESYIEREDELDNVNVLPSNSLAERPSCDPIGYECLHSYDASDSHPFIDVGVSPYFLNDPTGVFLTPPSNIICTGHTVVSRFRQRLPLRLLGSARDVMLERKARALFLRKASMARVRVPSAASRKRTVTARGGNTKLNNNKKKKKKLSFASMAETQEHNSTDDKCTASGTCSFLPLLAPSLTDGASEHGEPGLSTAAPSPSPLPSLLQGCTGTIADEADTDKLDVDVDVVDEAAGTHSLIKVSGGSSRNGDRDGDRPQHDDSDDSESDNESMSVPLSKPSSHPDDAEAEKRPALDPFLSVALSDVLPVPRRVLTGDFAVRLLKAKEVGDLPVWIEDNTTRQQCYPESSMDGHPFKVVLFI